MIQRDMLYDEGAGGQSLDQDIIAAQVMEYQNRKVDKAKQWGNISRWLIMIYVFVGGGYEIIAGISQHHIHATFVFSILSCFIFVGRIFYGYYAGATRTMWADVCGALMMLTLSVLHVIINGTFL